MGNEVAKPIFGGKVDISDMKSLAAKAQESAQKTTRGGAPNGSEYLNFSGKRGLYKIGQDERTIQNDERWVVDVTSFEEGFICWKGGKPASTRMANIYTGVPIAEPDPEEGGPFDRNKGDGWYSAKAFVLRSTDNGQQGYFKNNSVSGVAEMSSLMEEFSARAASGEPCWPVVCLDIEEFESQGFKNFKPIFDVQGWLSNEQLAELAAGADIDDLLAADEPAPVDKQVEAPKGRRRNRK